MRDGKKSLQDVSKNSKRTKNRKPPMLRTEHRGFYASPAWYALQVGGRETGRCLSGNRFFHSQIKHWASWQISTLMRFFERPGGFVDVILPQFVQKEKRQTRKPAASMRFREKSHPIKYYDITHPAFFQCLSAGILPLSGCNVSVLQCPATGAAQRTAKELFFGLPSQAVRF